MQQWEYLVATRILEKDSNEIIYICSSEYFKEIYQLFDRLGNEGWELVSTTPFVGPVDDRSNIHELEKLYFKRQKA